MKKLILILLILNYSFAFGQAEIPFFEQIAFDFYKDSLLTKFPVNKRIKIPKYTSDFDIEDYRFQVSSCLTGQTLTDGKELEIFQEYIKERMDFDSPTHYMNYENINKKQFKIKNSRSDNYPNLKISEPFHEKNDFEHFYIIISENYLRKNIRYYLLTDKMGKIKKWCRNESEFVIIH